MAENLAHIAEFPRYFARQLQEWLDSGRIVMGWVAEHSADRNDAIARAADHTVEDFRKQIDAFCASLAGVLGRLNDDDLDRPVRNVKYGEEPLACYLRRYVVGHKATWHSCGGRSTLLARSATGRRPDGVVPLGRR